MRLRKTSGRSPLYPAIFQPKRVVDISLLLAATLLAYYSCFGKATWGSELLFNGLRLIVWKLISTSQTLKSQARQTWKLSKPF